LSLVEQVSILVELVFVLLVLFDIPVELVFVLLVLFDILVEPVFILHVQIATPFDTFFQLEIKEMEINEKLTRT
jgi:hypothetical protein